MYPLVFHPIFKARVWGGRNLARLYGKQLPPNTPVGEAWEISDRPGDQSVIANGPLAGTTLTTLTRQQPESVLGPAFAHLDRFPLLIKIIDAADLLSLQVHPPAHVARRLRAEPKTEMWFVAHAEPGAELYLGLRRGVTRAEFEAKLAEGTVAECVHRISVRQGQTVFIPAGRLHALGAGLVVFEIQQNSDTTYRVFDWNRVGLDGRPRELHVQEALECIDFSDHEPGPVHPVQLDWPGVHARRLVSCDVFETDLLELQQHAQLELAGGTCTVLGVLDGTVTITDGRTVIHRRAGEFALMPAAVPRIQIAAVTTATLLRIIPGRAYANDVLAAQPQT